MRGEYSSPWSGYLRVRCRRTRKYSGKNTWGGRAANPPGSPPGLPLPGRDLLLGPILPLAFSLTHPFLPLPRAAGRTSFYRSNFPSGEPSARARIFANRRIRSRTSALSRLSATKEPSPPSPPQPSSLASAFIYSLVGGRAGFLYAESLGLITDVWPFMRYR